MAHDFSVIIVTIVFMLGLHFIWKLSSHNTRIRKLEEKIEALAKESLSDGMRYMPSHAVSQLIPQSLMSKSVSFVDDLKKHVTDEVSSIKDKIERMESEVKSFTILPDNLGIKQKMPISGTTIVPIPNAVFIDEDAPQK